MAKLDEKIGFIGGGNMAFAIGSGLINGGIVKAGQVMASGPNLDNLERWRSIGASVTDDNAEVIEKSDIIFISVKPHILEPCCQNLKSMYSPTPRDKDKLFVSVLAGVNLHKLENSFSFIPSLKMIRTMPNTPMQVGEGCTVYTPGSYVAQQDLEKVHLMLNTLGIAQQVPEAMIDAVTGVSGCGPAFVYTIIEALADGAVKQGVPRQMAIQFSAQTVLGAAKTVILSGQHPAVLRDQVCSPEEEEQKRRRQSSIESKSGKMKAVYNLFFKRTSTYAAVVLASVFFFERGFDLAAEGLFESLNKGKLWKDIKHKYE